MLDRRAQAGSAAEGVAPQIRPRDPEPIEGGRDVVGERLEAQRSIGVGRVAVALELDGDHPAPARQARAQRRQRARRSEPAVGDDQRHAAPAARLPVHPRRADRDVAGLDGVIHDAAPCGRGSVRTDREGVRPIAAV